MKNKYLRKKYKKLTEGDDDRETEAEGEKSKPPLLILASSMFDLGNEQNQDLVLDKKPTSIYGELKLSSQLLDKIHRLEDNYAKLKANLEMVTKERDDNLEHIKRLQRSLNTSLLKEQFTKKTADKLQKICNQLEGDNVKLAKQVEQLKYLSMGDKDTKHYTDKLESEKLQNKVIEFKHTNSLLKMETDIIGDRLNILNESIMSLGDAKQVEDRMKAMLGQKNNEIKKLREEIEALTLFNSKVITERDRVIKELSIHDSGFKKTLGEKEKTINALKIKDNNLEKDYKELMNNFRTLNESYSKLEKIDKNMKLEIDKLRQRLVKMKRRRNINVNQKICKNCQKEYLESDNFNWSCTTHQAEWGGKMWWCCGKTSKDAQG